MEKRKKIVRGKKKLKENKNLSLGVEQQKNNHLKMIQDWLELVIFSMKTSIST